MRYKLQMSVINIDSLRENRDAVGGKTFFFKCHSEKCDVTPNFPAQNIMNDSTKRSRPFLEEEIFHERYYLNYKCFATY